jgi:hypothetical protein
MRERSAIITEWMNLTLEKPCGCLLFACRADIPEDSPAWISIAKGVANGWTMNRRTNYYVRRHWGTCQAHKEMKQMELL